MKLFLTSGSLACLVIIFTLLSGCTISIPSTTSFVSTGYYEVEGSDLMESPIHPKIHLEITNRGDTHGKDVQQTLVFTMNGRKIHEERIYYGDVPAGSMRSKDIMVELSLRSDEIRALKQDSDLLSWEYAETRVNGEILPSSE